MRAPFIIWFFDNVFILKNKLKEKHKMITLGCLPISAKFNVFSQTRLSSYSPKMDVIILNKNLMHDKKFPQDPNHNYPYY